MKPKTSSTKASTLKPEFYDPKERAREKQAARDKDEEDLRGGKVTRDELSKRNGFFSSLDLKNSKVIRPGRFKS